MATPTELALLLQGAGSNEDYLKQDPFFMGGSALAQIPLPKATSNLEAWLGPSVQGLLTGLLTGYGRGQAKQSAWDDYRANPVLQAIKSPWTDFEGPLSPAQSEQALAWDALHNYGSEIVPEGWSPNIGRTDLLQATIMQQAAQEAEVKKADNRQKLQEMLMKDYGAAITPDGDIVRIPELANAKGALKAADKQAEIRAEADALGYNPKVEEETDKLRKEFSQLPEAKSFALVEKAGKIINEAIKDPSAVTDQELVRYSILLIEPGMAVREGEQRAVAASQSIPEEWRGSLTKALKGGSSLGTDVREGLKRLAERSYQGNKEQYDRTLDFYKEQATKKGLDPNRISYIGESAPSLQTRVIGGRTYYKVPGGWEAK